MAGERQTKPLGSHVELIRGTTYKSSLLGQPGPVLLGLATIERNGGFRSDNLKTYGGHSPARMTLGPGDLYVSLKDVTQSADLLGAIARVPSDVPAGRLTQDTVKLELKRGASADLIYWTLRTPQYRDYCGAHATGTTNLGLSRGDFLAFGIPPLDDSTNALLALLNAIEMKIDLNRRIAVTVEQTARSLFKSWFVDFDPVYAKAEGRNTGLSEDVAASFPDSFDDEGLPSHWHWKRADEIARSIRVQVSPKNVLPETPYVGLEHLPRKSLALGDYGRARQVESAKLGFETGDLLFGKLRPYFHKVSVVPFSGITSSDIFVFRASRDEYRGLMYFAFSEENFVTSASGASTGTRMPRAEWSFMSEQHFASDDGKVLETFNAVALAHVTQMSERLSECGELEQLRDALLPKLLSGELRVVDAGNAIAAA